MGGVLIPLIVVLRVVGRWLRGPLCDACCSHAALSAVTTCILAVNRTVSGSLFLPTLLSLSKQFLFSKDGKIWI